MPSCLTLNRPTRRTASPSQGLGVKNGCPAKSEYNGRWKVRSREAAMGEMRVECYAGYRADERPTRFTLRGHTFEIMEVEDRWYSPGAIYFRVRTGDGDYFVLRHDEPQDVWSVDAFRSSRERLLPEAGQVALS